MWSSSCSEAHSKLLSGCCPWCGRPVIRGHAVTWATQLVEGLGYSARLTGEPLEQLLRILHDGDIDVPFLVDRLDDPHRNVREACVRLLGRLGDTSEHIMRALHTVASRDVDPRVRNAARKAKDRLLGK